MAKYFLLSLILLGLALILPMTALAAWNDVQFTEDTNIDLTGIPLTLVVSADSKVASMTVYPTYVSFNFEKGSIIRITSADRKTLIANPPVASTTCETNSSWLSHSSTITQTVTITPGNTCTTPAAVTGTPGVTGGGGAPAAAAPAPAMPTTTTGTVTATAAAGGQTTVTSPEETKATVKLPIQGVSASTEVVVTPVAKTVAAITTTIAAVPTGQNLVGGYVYNFTATSAGAAVTTFSKEVTVTMTYTDAQIAGLKESSLTINRWDEATSKWVPLKTTVNKVTNTLTATTLHFSYFGIIGEVGVEEEVPTAAVAQIKTQMIEIVKQLIVLITQLIAELQSQIVELQAVSP